MTITLPLKPKKEAKLIAVAESKGMTANELLSQAINKIIAAACKHFVYAGTLFPCTSQHSR